MNVTDSIRPIPCTYFGAESSSSKKQGSSKLVLELYNRSEGELTDSDRDAIVVSSIQLKTSSSLFGKKKYGNMKVVNRDGMAGWVRVRLDSLADTYHIDLKRLKKAATTNKKRDITQFVRGELSDSYEEVSFAEMKKLPRELPNPTPGQILYCQAQAVVTTNLKAEMIREAALEYHYAPALFELGKHYLILGYGESRKAPHSKLAMQYFEEAATAGHVPSKLYLGLCMYDKNQKAAGEQLIRSAQALGDERADLLIRYFDMVKESDNDSSDLICLSFIRHVFQPHSVDAPDSLDKWIERIDARIKTLAKKMKDYEKMDANDLSNNLYMQIRDEVSLLNSFKEELEI